MDHLDRLGRLEFARQALKDEFFGLDVQIDALVDTISFWYEQPEVFDAPLVVNLWGLTGVGKTELATRLMEHLMVVPHKHVLSRTDHSWWSFTRNFPRGQTHQVFIFDEFQYLRQIRRDGDDYASHCDVWNLLNSGVAEFTPDDIESMFMALSRGTTDDDKSIFAPRYESKLQLTWDSGDEHHITSDRASEILGLAVRALQTCKARGFTGTTTRQLGAFIQGLLNDGVPLSDIVPLRDATFQQSLVFIIGNLEDLPAWNNIEDPDRYCDSFAKMTVSDVKAELLKHFHPEQVSRLGETHIIFPPMRPQHSRDLAHRLLKGLLDRAGVGSFVIENSVLDYLVRNWGQPDGGARALKNVVRSLFNQILIRAPRNDGTVFISEHDGVMTLVADSQAKTFPVTAPKDEITRKLRQSPHLKTIARHEACHVVVGRHIGLTPLYAGIASEQRALTMFEDLLMTGDILRQRVITTLAPFADAESQGKALGITRDLHQATAFSLMAMRDMGLQHWIHRLSTPRFADDNVVVWTPRYNVLNGENTSNEIVGADMAKDEYQVITLFFQDCIREGAEILDAYASEVDEVATRLETTLRWAP